MMAMRSALKTAEILKKLAVLSTNRATSSRFVCAQITAQSHLSTKRTIHYKPQSFVCRQNVAPPFPASVTRAFSTTTSEVENDDVEDDLYRQIDVEVKGHDPEVLKSYEKFVSMTARELDIKIGKISTPPKVITRRTLLKSVHIYKKHRVQYEWRTHFKAFEFKYLTGSTADTFLEYIQRNLPEGVAMKVTRYKLERLPEHISSLIEAESKSKQSAT